MADPERNSDYIGEDITVLDGLEPVKRRGTLMHNPAHPGQVLRDFLHGRPRHEFAARIGLSDAELGSLLAEEASVTLELSRRISAELGTSAELWVGMQRNWDSATTRRAGAVAH